MCDNATAFYEYLIIALHKKMSLTYSITQRYSETVN